MRGKYKIKKKHTISAVVIIIAILIVLIVMNTGYSLWNSKLNIYGKVTLDFTPPAIDVIVPNTGKNAYTTNSGFSDGWLFTYFDFVSDEYSENSLTTTIKVHSNLGMALIGTNITVGFNLKNISNEGYVYTNGTVTKMEYADPGGAISNESGTLSKKTILANNTDTFTFSAYVDRGALKNTTYYKYAITYDVNGVTRYFFYTIKILI